MKSAVSSPRHTAKHWLSRKFVLLSITAAALAIGSVCVAKLKYPGLIAAATASFGLTSRAGTEHAAGHEHSLAEASEAGHQDEAPGEHEAPLHDKAPSAKPETASAEPDHNCVETETIQLSTQARANIGVQLTRVSLQPFDRSIAVPGMVVERPGWSLLDVTSPMTGVVTRLDCVQGEAIEPGQPLFELRLTHEDLLQVQTEFLRTLEDLDVTGREVARLQKVAAEGAIPGKTILERQYDQQRQEAALRTLRQSLLLHGLNEEQVAAIEKTRTLIQSLTVFSPGRKDEPTGGVPSGAGGPGTLQIRELKAAQGKFVNAGDVLCTLANHEELYIEGQAFERDVPAVNRVASEGRGVTVTVEAQATDSVTLAGLKILYMDDIIDPQSRTFRFYVTLPNHVVRENKSPQGRRFVYWQFRPGQRIQINLPVERWENRIVLPVEAVANDGANCYVFEANGDHFDRRPVTVEYSDQTSAVIANDGTLRVGSQVATSAAHQMQLAMKNKAGGGVDPHAGHNH